MTHLGPLQQLTATWVRPRAGVGYCRRYVRGERLPFLVSFLS
jgi:hypothetical protein